MPANIKLGLRQEILTEGEGLSTVDIRIKITCFVNKKKIFVQYEKQLILTSQYNEVNCTDPSPSSRIPW